MNDVQKEWYPVCDSSELGKKPIEVKLFSEPIVLFRDSKAVVQALYNRCPHRGAPLSKGCVRGDTIRCPYHGWSFSGSGTCKSIPGICDMKEREIYGVQNFYALEKYGLIWISLGRAANTVPIVDELLDKSYSTFRLDSQQNSDVLSVVENALDPMHTHFVHKGWLRSNSNLSAQKVIVSTFKNVVEATYKNEKPQDGMIHRILTFNRSVRKSVGRFIYPNVIQLEYETNKNDHFLITGFVCPESEDLTKVFLFTSYKSKAPIFLFQWLVKYLFKIAIKQDQSILNMCFEHKKNIEREHKQVSTQVDLVGPYVKQLLEGKELPEKSKEIVIYV